jgi:hypothetical protein
MRHCRGEAHGRKNEETIMSTIVRSALIALVLTSASAAIARPATSLADQSSPTGGFSANSQEGARAFWDYQTRRGGN